MDRCVCERPDIHAVDSAIYCLSCGYYITPQEHVATASSKEPANYHYKPLKNPSSIRLVRLCGGPRTHAILCSIFHTTLEGFDNFEALSYTWGETTKYRTVNTPEGCLDVTENCFSALEDLRHEKKDRILWIDAICINQRSNSEKNHQVPLMNKIYKTAAQVLIYLGRHSRPQHSEQFFNFWSGARPDPHSNVYPRYSERSLSNLQRDVSEFLSWPWWSRVWILQEVAVAKKALLVWGASTIRWELLSMARVTGKRFLPVNLEGNVPPVFMFAGNDPRPLKSFHEFIHTARCCQSSEPRDKIYALLGLLDEHVVHNIVADYNRPLSELYAEFAIRVIDSHRNLNLFCFLGRETVPTKEVQTGSGRPRNPGQLPEDEQGPKPARRQTEKTETSMLARSETTVHTPVLERAQTSPPSGIGPDALSATEHQFQDTIGQIRKPSQSALPSWVPQLDDLPKLTSLSRFYPTPNPFTSAQCLCSERLVHAHPALKIRIFRLASVRSFEESSYAKEGHQSQSSFLASLNPRAMDMDTEVWRFLAGRQVLFTRDSWVACSYDTCAGDEVYLIAGAKVPFVLRPADQAGKCRSFELLGECYLDTMGNAFATSKNMRAHPAVRDVSQQALANLSQFSEYEDQQWEDACLV